MIEEFRQLARFRELLWHLVMRDLKVKYRRSVLGLLWSMLYPLLMLLVLYLVFSRLFTDRTDNYVSYVILGILVWQMFSQSTGRATRIFVVYAGIIKKARVPRSIFPLSVILSAATNFFIALLPAAVILLAAGTPIKASSILVLPLAIALFVLFSFGVASLLATLAVFFHDIVHMYEVFLRLLMYSSAIFYPASIVPDNFSLILEANPVYHFITLFRICVYDETASLGYYLASCSGFAIMFFGLGLYTYLRNQSRIVYYI